MPFEFFLSAFYFSQTPFQFSERTIRFFVSLQHTNKAGIMWKKLLLLPLMSLCRILENISGYFVWSPRNRREERRRIALRLWIIVKRSSIISRCNLRKSYVRKTETIEQGSICKQCAATSSWRKKPKSVTKTITLRWKNREESNMTDKNTDYSNLKEKTIFAADAPPSYCEDFKQNNHLCSPIFKSCFDEITIYFHTIH